MTYKKFAVKYKKIKMGRSLSFYAIDVNFPHEPHKMCINLEFQLEDDELEERLYDHLHSEDPKGPEGPKDYSYYSCRRANIGKCWDEKGGQANKNWCSRCHMFAHGLYYSSNRDNKYFYSNPAIQDSIDVNHSYGDPIWRSDWHFYGLYPGEDHNDWIIRFDPKYMYRMIRLCDIERMKSNLVAHGKAYRTPDVEAIEETQKVIQFCESYISKPNTTVIYSSEL